MIEQVDTFAATWRLVDELTKAMGAQPMNRHSGLWQCALDDQWVIAINGHNVEVLLHPDGGRIPPYSIYVSFNGWPAGLMDPAGGCIAAGSVANEQAFLEALRGRVALARLEGKDGND